MPTQKVYSGRDQRVLRSPETYHVPGKPTIGRTSHRRYLMPFLGAALCTILMGCQVPQQAASPTVMSCKLPKISALAETKESQEKGGLEIAVVPATYKLDHKQHTTIKQVPPPILIVYTDKANQVYVEEQTTTSVAPSPDRLQFAVRINNKLARVFRGQGAVVQINIGGKMVPFGRINYSEFINGIVPPRNETELTIYGPPLDEVPDKCTIGIYLYDVVSATDTAGNVTEKQNYEWFFDYATEPHQEPSQATTKRRLITKAELLRYESSENNHK